MSDSEQIEELKSQVVDLKIRIKRIEEFLRSFPNIEDYFDSDSDDVILEDAVKLVMQVDSVSAAFLQRKLVIGYARAARILSQLEEKGIIGPAEGSAPRKVLIRK